ncbi:transcription factor TFIIIC subunit tfc4 [Teratosphaeriaceae sp. CCFEE 6253]|nr:transcription factor TFIIIC subunit tfc4 [Teratosphaeriaceae sp. CCFEE 6253]
MDDTQMDDAPVDDTPMDDTWAEDASDSSYDSLEGFDQTLEDLDELENGAESSASTPDLDGEYDNEGYDAGTPLDLHDGDFADFDEAAEALGLVEEVAHDGSIHPYVPQIDATPLQQFAEGRLGGEALRETEWHHAPAALQPFYQGVAPNPDDEDALLGDEIQYDDDVAEDDVIEETERLDYEESADNYEPDFSDVSEGAEDDDDGDVSPSTPGMAIGDARSTTHSSAATEAIPQPSVEGGSALGLALARAEARQKEAQVHWSTRQNLGFPQDTSSHSRRDWSFNVPAAAVQDNPDLSTYFAHSPESAGSAIPGSILMTFRVLGDEDTGEAKILEHADREAATSGHSRAPHMTRPFGDEKLDKKLREAVLGVAAVAEAEAAVLGSKAMTAFLDGDMEIAMEWAQSAVKENPEISAAHLLLSDILQQMGEEKDSIGAMMAGAVIDRDPKTFLDAAQRTMQLADTASSLQVRYESISQAMACFIQAYTYAPKGEDLNVVARCGIRDISTELGDVTQARLYAKSVTKLRPMDFENVKVYAELCAATHDPSELAKAKIAYETAFEMMSSQDRLLTELVDEEGEDASWSHVNIYLELVEKLKYHAEGIQVTKRLARWILGRKDETFWDRYVDDDREFDGAHDRRALVGEFQQGRASRDRGSYGDGLPLELRVKLGMFRCNMGLQHWEEGKTHLDYVLAAEDAAHGNFDMFWHIGDSLRQLRMCEAALKFYNALEPIIDGVDEGFAMNIADCYESLHRDAEAEDTYRALVRGDPKNIQGRVKLARLYQRSGSKAEALALLNEVVKLGRKDALQKAKLPIPRPEHYRRRTGNTSKSSQKMQKPPKVPKEKKPKAPRPSADSRTLNAQLAARTSSVNEPESTSEPAPLRLIKSREPRATEPPDTLVHEMMTVGLQLEQMWHVVEGGGDSDMIEQWMQLATRALDEFRQEKAFLLGHMRRFTGYPNRHPSRYADTTRSTQTMGPPITPDPGEGVAINQTAADVQVPDNYYGLKFSVWHRVFSTLALIYADRADQAHCYDLLREILLRSNVFLFDDDLLNTSLAVALNCALKFNDSAYVTELVREYISKSEFRACIPYQLLAAATRLCYGTENEFHAHATKAYMARAVKYMDYNVMPDELRARIDFGGAAPNLKMRLKKFGKQPGVLPDAGVLTIYGNTMAISSHYTAALPYYLRALALQPDNFSINLCIGLTYVHQAMKRQTDNRQYGIQQGLAFLNRYHELRTASGKASHVQEATYNVAKTWHTLGLTHLAIPGYQKVLAMSAQVQAEAEADQGVNCDVEDLAQEAAYALQQMFALAGNDEAAVAITEQYLTL